MRRTEADAAPVIQYGNFINAIIKSVIISFAIFMTVKAYNKLMESVRQGKEEEEETPRNAVLLEEIRDLLAKR